MREVEHLYFFFSELVMADLADFRVKEISLVLIMYCKHFSMFFFLNLFFIKTFHVKLIDSFLSYELELIMISFAVSFLNVGSL